MQDSGPVYIIGIMGYRLSLNGGLQTTTYQIRFHNGEPCHIVLHIAVAVNNESSKEDVAKRFWQRLGFEILRGSYRAFIRRVEGWGSGVSAPDAYQGVGGIGVRSIGCFLLHSHTTAAVPVGGFSRFPVLGLPVMASGLSCQWAL